MPVMRQRPAYSGSRSPVPTPTSSTLSPGRGAIAAARAMREGWNTRPNTWSYTREYAE